MLERQVAALTHRWIVTYDYDAAVRYQLHRDRTRVSFSLSYSAQERRRGREAMFLSDSIEVPATWRVAERISIGPQESRYPLEAGIDHAPRLGRNRVNLHESTEAAL